ncbi:cobaltochelatase CobT-related protein [Rhizobium sp.]
MSFLKRLLGLQFLDEIETPARRRQPAPLPPPPAGYRIYTTEFDETISVPQIPARVEPLPWKQVQEFAEIKQQYKKHFSADRIEIHEAAGDFIRRLTGQCSQEERASTIVTILIDHSGSMRGMGILSACLAAEAVWKTLDRCGVASEIIGFTTSSWRGGQSRVKWIKAGSPPNPGRLCDLRYILYRSAGDARGKPPAFVDALYPDLLKENVDGEAILYAAVRLEQGEWTRRAIVVLSDGAPVDDATFYHNADQDILVAHLKQAIAEVEAKGIGIGYVKLEERAGDFVPANSVIALEPVAAARGLFEVAAKALGLEPARSDLDPSST